MISIGDNAKCCGCSACSHICPQNCISMQYNNEGFLYPKINKDKCINCRKCEKVCPFLSKNETIETPSAFGVIAKDSEIVFNSSSGGMFSVLAEKVLSEGGCVFGCAFSESLKKVHHIKIENVKELFMLRGSKYFQSEVQQSFAECKEELQKGRVVMFSGTPCQIAGLHKYLGSDYENLILVDIICHGTPSFKLWEKYAEWLEKKHKGTITLVNFRFKYIELKRSEMERLQESHYYYKKHGEDAFFKLFLNDVGLRESCYSCKVKGTSSYADITLGDFWGVENLSLSLNNTMGVSLAIVHNSKGKELFDSIRNKVDYCEVDINEAIGNNRLYNTSVTRPEKRDDFYKDLSY